MAGSHFTRRLERSAVHVELDLVGQTAFRRRRRRLEACEAVEAGDLPQRPTLTMLPMNPSQGAESARDATRSSVSCEEDHCIVVQPIVGAPDASMSNSAILVFVDGLASPPSAMVASAFVISWSENGAKGSLVCGRDLNTWMKFGRLRRDSTVWAVLRDRLPDAIVCSGQGHHRHGLCEIGVGCRAWEQARSLSQLFAGDLPRLNHGLCARQVPRNFGL